MQIQRHDNLITIVSSNTSHATQRRNSLKVAYRCINVVQQPPIFLTVRWPPVYLVHCLKCFFKHQTRVILAHGIKHVSLINKLCWKFQLPSWYRSMIIVIKYFETFYRILKPIVVEDNNGRKAKSRFSLAVHHVDGSVLPEESTVGTNAELIAMMKRMLMY